MDTSEPRLGRRGLVLALPLLIAGVVTTVGLVSGAGRHQHVVTVVTLLSELTASSAAIAATLMAVRRLLGRQRWAWLSLTGIAAVTGLGDIVDLAGMALGHAPPEIVAAVIPLVDVPLAAIGGALLATLYVPSGRWRMVIDALILTGSSCLIAWALVIRSVSQGSNAITILSDVSNPLGDIFFVIVVSFFIARALPADRLPMWLLLGAALSAMVGDTATSFATFAGTYYRGFPSDCGSIGSEMFLALSALCVRRVSQREEQVQPRLSLLMLQYGVLILAGIIAGVTEALETGSVDVFTSATLFVLLALLGLRQFLSSRENIALNARLREHAEQLAELELRFRGLAQNSSDVTIVVDQSRTVTYISPAVKNSLGWDPSEVIGARLDRLAHPADIATVSAWLGLISAEHRSRDSSEFRVRLSTGGWRVMEALASRMTTDGADGLIVINTRDITERRELEAQLRHEALHDPLTGLANRALMRDRIEHALTRRSRAGGEMAVLMVDLDDFKTVNDSLGHAAGDRLLEEVAGRITACLRASDTASRLGGDEFTCLLDASSDAGSATATAERLLHAIAQPITVGDSLITVHASIGIALSDDGVGADDLLRRADVAMYAAKESGRNTCSLFRPTMELHAHERLTFYAEMEHALAEDELEVYYQPLVDMTSEAMVGVEALVRWNHPTRGLVPPLDFIPLAEDTGLIIPLGRHVLDNACRQVAQWNREYHRRLHLAVNISPHQLQSERIVSDVTEALEATQLSPELLTIELTESALVDDIAASRARMEQLKAMGVRIALDDFGTGYSSLSYLRDLPIDILKIDRAFLNELGDDVRATKFVRAISDMARSLELETIAEGIEQLNELAILRGLGVTTGQGFYWSRPVTAGTLAALLPARDLRPGRTRPQADAVS